MEQIVKRFDELSLDELYGLLKARVAVFVVEQQCPYQEIDGVDKESYHVFFREGSEIIAYLRVVPKGVKFEEVSIGRVLSFRRKNGIGSRLLSEGLKVAREQFHAQKVVLEAQVQAQAFYEKAGFVQVSPEFLEDGIPHIMMELVVAQESPVGYAGGLRGQEETCESPHR